MAAKYILIIAVCLIVLQEGLSNTPAPTAGKANQGQVESKYVKQVENDGDAAEVGRVAAVGLEKSGFRQRHIHTNSPYYGDAYRYHYPQQGYGNEYGQDYAQSYGGNSPSGNYGQEVGRKF